MSKKHSTPVRVLQKTFPAPGLLRITAQVLSPPNFTSEARGAHIKLRLETEAGQLVMRTFTLADVSPDGSKIAIDFAQHDGRGPGALFAKSLKVGDDFAFFGPGKPSAVRRDCDDYFFLGDTTSFAAMKVHLKAVLSKATPQRVYLYFDSDPSSARSYFGPLLKDHRVVVHDRTHHQGQDRFARAVEAWGFGDLSLSSLWAAGERLAIQSLRGFLKEKGAGSWQYQYVSSYWQSGLREDQHSSLKRKDGKAQGGSNGIMSRLWRR